MDLKQAAWLAALGTLIIAVTLFATGCAGTKGVDWSGAIVCKDGVCTPTLTVSPALPASRAQLEK